MSCLRFETREDLKSAPRVIDSLLSLPWYKPLGHPNCGFHDFNALCLGPVVPFFAGPDEDSQMMGHSSMIALSGVLVERAPFRLPFGVPCCSNTPKTLEWVANAGAGDISDDREGDC